MERERICDKAAAALEMIGGDAAQRALDAWRGITEDTPTEPERPSPYAIFDDMIDENGDLLLPYDDLDDTQPRASAADHDDWPLVDDALTEEPFARALTNQQLAQMIEALHNGDWRERQEAAKELRSHVLHVRHLADETFAQHLIAALDDSDQTVRWTATEALAWVAHPSVPHALARMLQDKSWSVRLAALRSLYEHNDASVIEQVARAARDKQALVREAAVAVLGKLGRAEAVPTLTTCLRDAEGFVRRAAAEALGSLRASSAVPALIEALEDVEHQVRYAAVEALGKIGDPAAVRSIARLLRDTATPLWTEGRSLSQATLDALAKIGSPDAKKVIEFWRSRTAKSS
jgi:HEAT repeat protein